jgi:ATP-dependent DNA helicase DinG
MRSPRRDEPAVRKLFTSATLSDANASHALRFKGFWSALRIKPSAVCCEASCAPKYFGDMRFVLAARDVPEPFCGDANNFSLSEEWLDYCAHLLTQVAQHGAALVLTHSYEETEKLSALLRVAHIAHRRGAKLSGLIAEFRARRSLLLTPAAWEGISLRREDGTQLFRELVITRLPFARTSEEELAALRVHARRRGGGIAPESIAFTRRVNEAKRKLHQGLGRGIRSVFDNCRVWIADPRFPRPDEVSAFGSLRSAIPDRFWESYQNADYFSRLGSVVTCRKYMVRTQGDVAMQYL